MEKITKYLLILIIFFSLSYSVNAKDKIYKLETLYEGLDMPWDIDFLPNGDFLVSELTGNLKIYNPSLKTLITVSNVPSVLARSQGGLSDVELHPDFELNNLIYLSYSIKTKEGNTLRVSRAKLHENTLIDVETIFTAQAFRKTSAHYGARLLFLNDNTLLISSGDGFNHREKAQELDNHFGKILRINDDGSIPGDNPIFKENKALKDIFTYGHRNQQGLTKDIDGIIYSHEHGPKGGDELNIINPGLNYGWPAITYGIDYSGSIISPFKKKEGMEQPIKFWTPSIALSDMTFYYSDLFPEWYGNLFISALSPGDVRRLVIKDNIVVSEEIMFKEINSRIRSIKSSKNGNLIILTDGRGKKNSGKIIKVSPDNL
jgi:glucose/arabinose dehydrogenase